ncbi:MAG: DUF192 domain-containing protein [Alphaproteobacteria bacterium]|nr:DUF192 domain-containing protein [Alphaproteobacteria bacterium]
MRPTVVALVLGLGCAGPPCGAAARVHLGADVQVCATVAATEQARRDGLTALPPLGPGDGLLLQYPATVEACITTAPMAYAIDVVFLDATDRVVDVACDRGADDPLVCTPGTRAVLEVLPRAACPGWVGAAAQVQR